MSDVQALLAQLQPRALYLEGVRVFETEAYGPSMLRQLDYLRENYAAFVDSPYVRGYGTQLSLLGFPETRPANLKLIDRCLEQGPLSINNVVDAYNVAALTYGASLGGHALAQRPAALELRLARPGERILPLFQSRTRPIAVGSLVYGIGDELLACIGSRDVDADGFRITAATQGLLLVSLGHADTSAQFNEQVLDLALELVRITCPAVQAWPVPVTMAAASAAAPA